MPEFDLFYDEYYDSCSDLYSESESELKHNSNLEISKPDDKMRNDDLDFTEFKESTVYEAQVKTQNSNKSIPTHTFSIQLQDGWALVSSNKLKIKDDKLIYSVCRDILNGGVCNRENCLFLHADKPDIIMEHCHCVFGEHCAKEICYFVHQSDTSWEIFSKRVGIGQPQKEDFEIPKLNDKQTSGNSDLIPIICKNMIHCSFGTRCRYIHTYELAKKLCKCRFQNCRYVTQINEHTYINSQKGNICRHVHENENIQSLKKRGIILK